VASIAAWPCFHRGRDFSVLGRLPRRRGLDRMDYQRAAFPSLISRGIRARKILEVRERTQLHKQMSRGLSASSMDFANSDFGDRSMSAQEKKRRQITDYLNLDARVQAKKQQEILQALPEGEAKVEMKRVLKLNKLLGEGGGLKAVKGMQQFLVFRERSTDGGKTVPFTLRYALVSEMNGMVIGAPVHVKTKKWPTWKVSKLDQEIADERVQLPRNLRTPVSQQTLRALLKTLDERYDQMILMNQMHIAGVEGQQDGMLKFHALVNRLQKWRNYDITLLEQMIRAPLRAIALTDVNKHLLDHSPAISVITQLAAHPAREISQIASQILNKWHPIIHDRVEEEALAAEIDSH